MNRKDFRTGLGQITYTEEDQGMDKITEVGQDMILTLGLVMEIIQEVIRDMGDIVMIIEGETLGIKIMIGIGVGHMRDKVEIEDTIEALVTADQDHI